MKLQPGTRVRVFSWAGPCMPAVVTKANRTTHTLDGNWKVINSRLHTEPCERCTDHPHTSYPNGYMD